MFNDDPYAELIEGARIWICGVEVTPRVNSAISVIISGRGGRNTASFSMSNSNDGFMLTDANMDGVFNITGNPGEYSERIKRDLFNYKTDRMVNGTDKNTGGRRWPIAANRMVLHAFDPVFIAESWPYSEEDLWIPRFKGYIESKPVDEDMVTGRSVINVSCIDIRGALMERMRVQMNYLIGNQLALVTDLTTGEPGVENVLNILDPVIQDGIFADLRQPTTLTTPLAGLSLKDTIEFLITGNITDTKEFDIPGYSNSARQAFLNKLRSSSTISVKGVGKMTTGVSVAYPNGNGTSRTDVRILEEWHRLSLFGVPGTDTPPIPDDLAEDIGLTEGQKRLFALSSRPWTTAEVEAHGEQCTWDGDTAPHNMSLHFLLPSTEGGMAGITGYTEDSISPERRWQSRLSIIEDYLEALDYHWAVTPIGDVIVEFPTYDFKPESFGEFEEAFTIKHNGQGKFIRHEDDRPSVPTAMIVTSGYNPQIEVLSQFTPATFNESESTVLRVSLQAPLLASRIGMRVETHTMPFALDSVCRLRQFAVLKFQKALSELNTLGIDTVYRPLFMPNRPIAETLRDRMAWISQVSYGNHPGRPREYGYATSSLVLKYVRLKEEDGTYRLLTGSEYLPLSYTGKGVGIEPARGIIIDDSISIAGQCGQETVGAPPVTLSSSVLNDVADDCSDQASELASDVLQLWNALREQAEGRYQLSLQLTCTHRDGTSDPHESLTPDLHLMTPARAFDIEIYKHTGESGTDIDYARVGELGMSLGLEWGGTSSGGKSIQQMRASVISRANFHVNRKTDYIFGGTYDPGHSMGVDCSGLIIDCYTFAGILNKTDPVRTAAQLEARFKSVSTPSGGDLAFFGLGGATHVVIVDTDGKTLIGASGGNQNIQTIEQARVKNARVKKITAGISYRDDFRGYASPFIGMQSASGYSNHFFKRE